MKIDGRYSELANVMLEVSGLSEEELRSKITKKINAGLSRSEGNAMIKVAKDFNIDLRELLNKKQEELYKKRWWKLNFREYIKLLTDLEANYQRENKEWYEGDLQHVISSKLIEKYGEYEVIRPFSNDVEKLFNSYYNDFCIIRNMNTLIKLENVGDNEPSKLHVSRINKSLQDFIRQYIKEHPDFLKNNKKEMIKNEL